jgi:hypothetical protein
MPAVPAAAASSHFLTREIAARAVELAGPMLRAAAHDGAVNQSGVLYLVVTDPLRGPQACASFEEAILHEQGFGRPPSEWDADYAGFARAKARLSWQTGLDSHVVQVLQPHLLRRDDTALWGSVNLDGIVVGVSGNEAAYDEAFAGAVAMLARALSQQERARLAASQLVVR